MTAMTITDANGAGRFDADVRMTPEDVAHGGREDCHGCPVALAVVRAVRDLFGLRPDTRIVVSVDEQVRVVLPDGGRWLAYLPDRRQPVWIGHFDAGRQDVEPLPPFTLVFEPLGWPEAS